jgi:preprotein translocase SecE subunit
MADDEAAEEPKNAGKEKSGEKSPSVVPYASKSSTAKPGFFTIYKRGQGYWTRVGTVIGAALIGGFTAYSLYEHVPTFISSHDMGIRVAGISVAAFLVVYVGLCWYLLNKPTNVDFLVATDSEMKKVNWTSRKELIGSTKVVVVFMFLVALFLFSVDWIFGTLMYFCKVLSVPPWGA